MKRFRVVFLAVLLLGLASCTKTPKVSFTDESIEISVGETRKINYEITEGYEAEFILPNNTIVSISGENITGVSAGQVELTVKVKGTEISATINVIVTLATIEVTEVSISGKNSGLVGEMITLTATVLPANATDKTIAWSSNDETLATVTNGNVSLLKAGSVTITATAGTKSATHIISISDPVVDVDVETVTISGKSLGETGDTITLTVTVLPENATDKTVVWSSSDETLATVSNGVVTLLKVGAVTITARAGEVEDRHVITITDPIIAVESITISGETVGEVDEIITLVATVLPENATDKMVIWLSSDETLATVSDGVVTLLKAGNVTITAKNGAIETTHEITINESVVLVESITIAGENSGLVGDEITLTATVLPANATDKTIVWSSSDETLATVSDGIVTLLKAGNVTITASVGEVNKTHMISIENPIVNVDSITIEGDSVGEMGDTITLTATVLPANATDKTIVWSSSDETLATVSDGVVTLLKVGSVTITAKNGEIETTHEITINEPVIPVESITITGETSGLVGDEITLTATVLPENATNQTVVWNVDVTAFASVVSGVVSLDRVGTVYVSATIDDITVTHQITINAVAAYILSVKYATIQEAINAAKDNDVINIVSGTHNEVLTINKSNISLTSEEGGDVILTNKINIGSNLVNLSFTHLLFTGDAQFISSGPLTGFTFTNNEVYDTNLVATPYAPITRINVNAFIQFGVLAGTDIFGNITIEDNIFNHIQSDIISIHRTKAGTSINIRNNEFRNFDISVIRFDGGYNNGTYNITGNLFENDVKQAEAAILFRSYAPSAGNVQTINISNNTFKNIGNESNNPTSTQPASGVIVSSTWNSNETYFNVLDNWFINTHNSIHLRKNEITELWHATITGNTFENPTGYMFYEDGNYATFNTNIYLDRLGVEVDPLRVITTTETTYRSISIKDPVLVDFEISGNATGETTDEIVLNLDVTPPYFILEDVVWSSSSELLATVTDGVVSLLDVGVVTISATYGEVTKTINITITQKVAASIGEVDYFTIQAAIDAALPGEVIQVNQGTFDEILTIDKSLSLVGFPDKKSVLTNLITITSGLTDIIIDGFSMTGKAQIKSTGTLERFSFINNHVYDTDLVGTSYSPTTRINVNAIIQLYRLADSNVFGDITISNNLFNNIKSDIISIDRTMVNKSIDITNNQFRNFKIGAIRFDGGYNNGTYNITGNLFENDIKQAETAITFRAYSSSAGNVQTINITNNTFKNIGNEFNNPTSSQPASAVIGTSTWNSYETNFNVLDNMFINTHNSIHMRKNEVTTLWHTTITGNSFTNPTGYIYYEDSNSATVNSNTYYDIFGTEIVPENIEDTRTSAQSIIKVKDIVGQYVVVTYTYNEETVKYDVIEDYQTSIVGKTITIIPETKLGYYTEFDKYTGVILEGELLIIEIYYELITEDPNAFDYELVLNGGNFDYPTRDALVRDFIADYNVVNNKAYTLETLNMGAWSDIDYHLVFYHASYRDKWLWLAEYLGVVGSSTNKQSAKDIVTYQTAAEFTARSANWVYAFSYEVRGFLKGVKYENNALWMSADYSELTRANGFWDTYATHKIPSIYRSDGAVEILPVEVYKDGYDFIGWFNNVELTGSPFLEITAPTKLYAKFEEKNPVTGLTISNSITELEKGSTYQLNVEIAPVDAFNKTLIYYTSDSKVATISETGLITAVNEGDVIIKVTNYNGVVFTEMSLHVYPKDDLIFNFSDGFNGFLEVNNSFTFDVIGIGKLYSTYTFNYQVEDGTILEFTAPNLFKGLLAGSTQIDIYEGENLLGSYTVHVQETLSDVDRVDQLLQLLANSNNAIATGVNVVPYYTASQEWIDARHESVNLFLFDDFVVDTTSYPADPNLKSGGIKTSTEFIVVHDTANLSGGLMSHGSFFQNPANEVSIHYTTGDYGILRSLEDQYVAFHAGDGTSVPFAWIPTGVTAIGTDKPVIDMSVDGYFTFNGVKSTVLAPKGKDGEMLDSSHFTYLGPSWDIVDGEYVIGTTYFNNSQQSYGIISSRGGNLNSIGIEMNVNTDGDIIDTVQRTAKLVAHLLEQYDLSNYRVVTHNQMSGKMDSYTLNNTVYNGTWYFDRFMEHVEVERSVLANFSDAIITFSSTSPLVSSTGRVIVKPEVTTEVEYTIEVTIGEVTKSITLISVVPGINTWDQYYGFYVPTQPWAKADYRN